MLNLFRKRAGNGDNRTPAPPPVMREKADFERMWLAIRDLPFDQKGAEKPFSTRLASEQGWSSEFTARVIEEYRRFVFMMAVSDHSVTPSITVDEAWHTHLIYTKSYWEDLCLYTVGKPLHHNPSGGSAEESDGFKRDYRYTLDLYRHYFGAPPEDIWGPNNGRNVTKKS